MKITMKGIETTDEYGEKCWFLPSDRKTYSYEEAKKAMDEYNESHGYKSNNIIKKIMKKILIFIFCLMIFMSCVDGKGKCQVNYSVIYPDTTITYDTVFNYEWAGENDHTHIPYASSYRGTNYIRLGYYEFARTTCPIRINSYKSLKSK